MPIFWVVIYGNLLMVVLKKVASITQGGEQGIDPSTMKPGSREETHVPLPEGYWDNSN